MAGIILRIVSGENRREHQQLPDDLPRQVVGDMAILQQLSRFIL